MKPIFISAFTSSTLFEGSNPQFQSLTFTWIMLMLTVALLCFIVSEITRNYSQVDKLWSLMPVAYSWITYAGFPSTRVLLMALIVTLWGLRLSYNFARKGGYSLIPWKGEEDYRWKIMRENPYLIGRFRFGIFNLLFISLYQNILILLFSTPLLLAAQNSDAAISAIDITAGTLMIIFLVTETIADNQLFRYQTDKKKAQKGDIPYTDSLRKGFMTEGLWKYSRHPNFASEQAIWVCFYFFGVAASGRWINITIAGPLLLILLFIGSSELTEKISGSKYPGYNSYRKEVPRFVPIIFSRKKS